MTNDEWNCDGNSTIRHSSFVIRVGVIILAAGASSRMGRPKLLLPWRGATVLSQLVTQWRELGAVQIAVVMRPDDTALAAELDRLAVLAADRIFNPQPERGMFSSIVCAANWSGWRTDLNRWAIVLGDQPHLQRETLKQLLEASARNAEAICQPRWDGHGRHPVVLPGTAFAALKTTGAATLKDFLKLCSSPLVLCSIADPGLSFDMDTPEDYLRLVNFSRTA
ncbi:MAG TPA: nucleotidyltransferase family protein [Verrucomicrobiae bacterium]